VPAPIRLVDVPGRGHVLATFTDADGAECKLHVCNQGAYVHMGKAHAPMRLSRACVRALLPHLAAFATDGHILARAGESALDGALRRLGRTREWYGRRLERLSAWARANLSGDALREFFNIVANGREGP
jgi:hypothetical protein